MKLLFEYLGFSITTWIRFIYYNFICGHVKRSGKRFFIPHRHVAIQLDNGSKIILNGTLFLGRPQVMNSKIETRVLLEENAILEINGLCFIDAGSFIRVTKNSKLAIGRTFINENVQITCGDSIIIGNGCAIGRDVIIRSFDGHELDLPDYKISKAITIGDHVWIGQGANIMKGVSICCDSVIAASALVTKNVESNTIVGGNPARVIKTDVKWH